MSAIQTTWTTDSLLQFLYNHRSELRQMGFIKIGVFGSYSRDEQKSTSDIDILFAMNPFTWRNWMNAWNFLEATLGVSIDLIPEEDLRPEIRPFVLREVRYVEDL